MGTRRGLGSNTGDLLRLHERAFRDLGRVALVIRHDNLKAAVVRACFCDSLELIPWTPLISASSSRAGSTHGSGSSMSTIIRPRRDAAMSSILTRDSVRDRGPLR